MNNTLIAEMVAFFRRELMTKTWAHCLAPTDLDILSGMYMAEMILGGVGGQQADLSGKAQATMKLTPWGDDVEVCSSGVAPLPPTPTPPATG